jgi:hypothetical protein
MTMQTSIDERPPGAVKPPTEKGWAAASDAGGLTPRATPRSRQLRHPPQRRTQPLFHETLQEEAA